MFFLRTWLQEGFTTSVAAHAGTVAAAQAVEATATAAAAKEYGMYGL
jgi:hypothetical protein